MFDSKQTLTTRLADATDLLIDFATLGEYGLEPAGSTPGGCDSTRIRPMPIADRQTFTEVLFPNRCRTSPTPTIGATGTTCSNRSRPHKFAATRGSGPNVPRKRGFRGASMSPPAGGVA